MSQQTNNPLCFPTPWSPPLRAIVVGANGGLGRAFVDVLLAHSQIGHVYAIARTPITYAAEGNITPLTADILNEDQLNTAAEAISIQGEVHLIVVATGMLHDKQKAIAPEKSWRALNAASLAQNFAINTIGPALVAKALLPLLSHREKSVFAALSARVGSIEDNRLGGWHGYRASKAALNMMIKTLSIELATKRPHAQCVALHPGTVDTDLSKPYQKPHTNHRLFTAMQAATRLLQVITALTPQDNGGFFSWDGKRLPY